MVPSPRPPADQPTALKCYDAGAYAAHQRLTTFLGPLSQPSVLPLYIFETYQPVQGVGKHTLLAHDSCTSPDFEACASLTQMQPKCNNRLFFF